VKSIIIGLLAETSLHPGAGQTAEVIDLPVAREVSTSYPVIVGSSMKGALRDRAEQEWKMENKEEGEQKVKEIFGRQDTAGAVAVTDARLLLLPVRSLNGHFKWVTCHYLLERYQRDMELAGFTVELPELPEVADESAIAEGQRSLFLEELSFDIVTADMGGFARAINPLIRHQKVRERLPGSLVVVNDNIFAYFAKYGLQVSARNELYKDTKTSKNLWYEETVPPESLFYSLIMARPGKEAALDELVRIFAKRPYLQVGGNETVGQGWCAVSCLINGGEG